jgi:tRNA pseudouridine38-40 synthase
MQEVLSEKEKTARRLRCRVAYDGTGYAGWQYQPGAPTVQGTLERAILAVTGETVRVTGAGRTDSGVHATGQMAHWDTLSDIEPAVLERALNARLEQDIRVRDLGVAEPGFHARFSACAREYSYSVFEKSLPESVLRRRFAWVRSLKRLDSGCLNDCASTLNGEHDFSAFHRGGSDTKHNRCLISLARWEHSGSSKVFYVRADRFLRGMVRMLVGAVVATAEGKAAPEAFTAAFERKSHWLRAVPAPACGLTLIRVDYPGDFDINADREECCV